MPSAEEVLADVQREVKRIGQDVPALRLQVEKDLKEVRDIADAAKNAADTTGQTHNDIKALAEGVAAKHEAIAATVKKIEDEAIKAANDRLDNVEKLINRMRLGGGADAGDVDLKNATAFARTRLSLKGQLQTTTVLTPEMIDLDGYKAYCAEFPHYLRRKDPRQMDQNQFKAMSVGSDPAGGYFVTPATNGRIETIVYESSPMRQLATIEAIGFDAYEYAIDDAESDAGWVGETEARPVTANAEVGVGKIPVHEMYAAPKATQKLIEDSSIDIEAWLGGKTGEKFGRLEATGFVSGNGVKKPRGFLTFPAGTARGQIEQIVSGHATEVTSDGLIDLTIALKEEYVGGAVFLMRRATVGKVLLLKDGNGQYIWRQDYQAGKPALLLGHPCYQAADMAAVGAGALAIAFGNFKRGYTIVDRLGISTLVDPYTVVPFVKFYTRKRVGGDVTNFEAIKLQKIAAA